MDPDEDPGTRVAKLVAGDVAAILVFAAIGRGNHGEGVFVGDVFATALPFLIGWFAVSPVAGTFGEEARVRRRSLFRPSSLSLFRPSSREVVRSVARALLSPLTSLSDCSRAGNEGGPRGGGGGEGVGHRHSSRSRDSRRREGPDPAETVRRRRHGRHGRVSRRVAGVVRQGRVEQGRKQAGESSGVHEPAHVSHEAVVRRGGCARESMLSHNLYACHIGSVHQQSSRFDSRRNRAMRNNEARSSRLLARPARRGGASAMKRAAALRVLGVSDDLDSNAVRQAYRCVQRRARPPRCRSARAAFPVRGVSLVFEPGARPRSEGAPRPNSHLPTLPSRPRPSRTQKTSPATSSRYVPRALPVRSPDTRPGAASASRERHVSPLRSPAEGTIDRSRARPPPSLQTKIPATPRRSSDSRRW